MGAITIGLDLIVAVIIVFLAIMIYLKKSLGWTFFGAILIWAVGFIQAIIISQLIN